MPISMNTMEKTDLAEKYHFSDFTRAHYEECIDLAKKNYKFISYGQAKTEDNYVLWRHDVDYSMHIAKKLAEIEHSKNVKATYFIYPHCEYYNLLEKEISDLNAERAGITEQLSSGNLDFEAINQLSERIMKINNLLEEKEMRWLELSEIVEQ